MEAVPIAGGYAYPVPVEQLALERLTPGTGGVELRPVGPEILLVVHGTARITVGQVTLELVSDQSLFVPASADSVHLIGEGFGFRATVGARSGS